MAAPLRRILDKNRWVSFVEKTLKKVVDKEREFWYSNQAPSGAARNFAKCKKSC